MKNYGDYVREELQIIEARLRSYTEYGYSPHLEPIVDVLYEFRDKMKELLNEK